MMRNDEKLYMFGFVSNLGFKYRRSCKGKGCYVFNSISEAVDFVEI